MDPANAAELRQLLLYHVIVADVTPDQIQGKKGGVPTAADSQILLDGTGSAIKAGRCDRGQRRALTPPTARSSPSTRC